MAGPVQAVQFRGQSSSFVLVAGQKQPRGQLGVADPARGIEARCEHEPDAVAGEGLVGDARDLEQSLQPGTRAASDCVEADAGENSVLVRERDDVGNGAEADEVEQGDQLFFRSAQGGEYAPGELERDADPGQLAERILRIGPLRIDHGESRR